MFAPPPRRRGALVVPVAVSGAGTDEQFLLFLGLFRGKFLEGSEAFGGKTKFLLAGVEGIRRVHQFCE
jgi:hypothetical protein